LGLCKPIAPPFVAFPFAFQPALKSLQVWPATGKRGKLTVIDYFDLRRHSVLGIGKSEHSDDGCSLTLIESTDARPVHVLTLKPLIRPISVWTWWVLFSHSGQLRRDNACVLMNISCSWPSHALVNSHGFPTTDVETVVMLAWHSVPSCFVVCAKANRDRPVSLLQCNQPELYWFNDCSFKDAQME
jgi:hypothetical protein